MSTLTIHTIFCSWNSATFNALLLLYIWTKHLTLAISLSIYSFSFPSQDFSTSKLSHVRLDHSLLWEAVLYFNRMFSSISGPRLVDVRNSLPPTCKTKMSPDITKWSLGRGKNCPSILTPHWKPLLCMSKTTSVQFVPLPSGVYFLPSFNFTQVYNPLL